MVSYAMGDEQALVEVRGLAKSYGRRAVLHDINFTVRRGESFAITGPSGSGKSTVLNILGMLERYDGGEVLFAGKKLPDINSNAATRLRRYQVSYLFQSFALLNDRTVFDNLMIAMKYVRESSSVKKQRIQNILGELGIDYAIHDKIAILSGGEQQRVAMARAMLKPGLLILADEPTGSLDHHLAEQVFHQLQVVNKEYGKTLIIVTHDPLIAQQCDRLLQIDALPR